MSYPGLPRPHPHDLVPHYGWSTYPKLPPSPPIPRAQVFGQHAVHGRDLRERQPGHAPHAGLLLCLRAFRILAGGILRVRPPPLSPRLLRARPPSLSLSPRLLPRRTRAPSLSLAPPRPRAPSLSLAPPAPRAPSRSLAPPPPRAPSLSLAPPPPRALPRSLPASTSPVQRHAAPAQTQNRPRTPWAACRAQILDAADTDTGLAGVLLSGVRRLRGPIRAAPALD